MTKTPPLRETKKKAKEATPKKVVSKLFKGLPIPPSLQDLARFRSKSPYWNEIELHHLLKLQASLSGRKLPINARVFKRLWHACGKKCELTGVEFGKTDAFDVGVDISYKGSTNYRVVLLPLAVTRAKSCHYSLYVDKIHEYFNNLQVTRIILRALTGIILDHVPSRTYAVTVSYSGPKKRMSQPQPQLQIHAKVMNLKNGYVEKVFIVGASVVDETIEFYGQYHHRIESWHLSDPNFHLEAAFAKFYDKHFKINLANAAQQSLAEWKYE